LYLMELASTGIDLYPTGRVVMFSNSVLFQARMPLFRQIPGTEIRVARSCRVAESRQQLQTGAAEIVRCRKYGV
jgi:hypothetical protein